MFCSLNELARIGVDDIRSISAYLSQPDTTGGETQPKEKAQSKRNLKSEGLVAPDADPITDDESETEAAEQEWPAWESTSETDTAKQEEADVASKWLRNCLIAASPSLDIIAIAEVQHLAILERSVHRPDRMQVAAKIEVEADYITAIYVLPLASTRRTEASQVDWTCIVVALASGWVNFYTERGILILREHVSYGPIRCLRFGQSFFPGNQELVALSGNTLYIMEGLSLFTILKTARNEVARGERTVTEIGNDLPITSHCVQLAKFRRAYDTQLLGIGKPSLFNQYVTASLERRPMDSLYSTASHIFCTTSTSFATFLLFDSEDTSHTVLSDALHQISSKISAAVPSIGFRSFFGLGQSRKDRPQKTSVADARRVRIGIRSSLVDPGRHSERTFVSFGAWNLMAICDEKARVILVDTKTRSAIRIWKGYRSARCAFIEAVESADSAKGRHRKKALFLAIFAPRRAILEVWSLRYGPRVAAYNVDPKGRLLNVSLPRDGVLLGQSSSAPSNHLCPTAIFLTSDGKLQTINVPFHLAALAKANRLHDENLLKESRLDNLIRADSDGQLDFQPFLQVLSALKITDCQRRLLERMISDTSSRRVSVDQIDTILSACSRSVRTDLQSHVDALKRLLSIYKFTIAEGDKCMGVEAPSNDKLRDLLLLSIEEYADLNLDLLIASQLEVHKPHAMSLAEFRDQFAFDTPLECKNILVCQQADRTRLSLHIFSSLLGLANADDIEAHFKGIFDQIRMQPSDLLDLFFAAWLNTWNRQPWRFVRNGLLLLGLILARFDDSTAAIETLEQAIYQSYNARAALFLFLIYRAYTKKSLSAHNDENQMEWETLDDRAAWNVLASRHLSVMALIEDVYPESQVGLARLAEKGFGFYREQIGQFVAHAKLPPERVIEASKAARVYSKQAQDANDSATPEPMETSSSIDRPSLSQSDLILTALFRHFPFSFATELLLCDCAWECASRWYRGAAGTNADHAPPNRSIEHLELAMDYLSRTTVVARLQHGLALMIWDTFVQTPFKCLIDFVRNNSGRMPSDRQLRKEVFVCEMDLPRFVRCVRRLLRTLQSSVVDLEMMPTFEHKYEDFVESFFENRRVKVRKNRSHTLTEVASGQRSVNYHLVLHHVHLTIVIELQLLLNLRIPLDEVFPELAQRAFFTAFYEHPLIPISDVDDDVKERRQRFMEDAVGAIGVHADQAYHEHWELVNELTKDWALDADLLRIKEIFMLHEGNYDRDAEKLYPSVQNRRMLAVRLTPIAMGRFKALAENNTDLKSKAQKKLKSTTWNAVKSLPDTFAPNFEPTLAETLPFIEGILYIFNYSTKATKEHFQQLPSSSSSNEKRLLIELRDFLKSTADETS